MAAAAHKPLREQTPTHREALAERVACRLDLPVTAAGVLLVLVVIADNLTPSDSALSDVWTISAWILWALFALEFVARLVIAPSTTAFLRRNWWQLAFLVVPFLRFLRAFTRAARFGRLASTSLRTTRTANRTLAGRIGWLLGVSVGTVLGASEILFAYGPSMTYADALHGASMGAIGGEPIDAPGTVARVLEVLLVLHATVIFAALAGSLGAYFLERRGGSR